MAFPNYKIGFPLYIEDGWKDLGKEGINNKTMNTRKTKEGEFVPFALIGDEIPVNYPDCFAPVYENNVRGVLHVCICDGCEDAKPRLKELAKMFRLSLFYQDKDENIKPINKLFE